jgi:hypothetical protein
MEHCLRRCLWLLAWLFATPVLTPAATLTVSHDPGSDFNTLSAAVASATAGDEIVVASGVYSASSGEAFPISVTKELIIEGLPGESKPVLMGDGKSSVVVVSGGKLVTFDHVMVTGGGSSDGAGIRIIDADTSLIQSDIIDNRSPYVGAGVLVERGILRMDNCTIGGNEIPMSNWTDGLSSAVVGFEPAVLQIRESRIVDNESGGIVVQGSASITDTNISRNAFGGLFIIGLFVRPYCILDHCIVDSNRTGGIYAFYDSSLYCRRSQIIRNTECDPAGIACLSSDIGKGAYSCENCIIAMNSGGVAGIYSNLAQPELRSCTIYGNSNYAIYGGRFGGGANMENCVVYEHPKGLFSSPLGYGGVLASWSDIEGGFPGKGNIDEGPRFVDPVNGDFRLLPDSPCIDSASIEGPTEDLPGFPRPVDIPGVGREGSAAFDMGAYEFQIADIPTPTETPTPTPILTPTFNPNSDINEDGRIDAKDLVILLEDWKKVSGPWRRGLPARN